MNQESTKHGVAILVVVASFSLVGCKKLALDRQMDERCIPWFLRCLFFTISRFASRKDCGMTHLRHSPSRAIRIGLLLTMGIGMSACSDKWKEEVQLSDGRIVVVERETLRERGGDEWAFNPSGTKPKEYRIRFQNTFGSGEMIEWKSIKNSPGRWPEHPLVFDRESDQFIVFSSVFSSSGCHIYSKYLFRNGAWIEEALPQKFEVRMSNLLIHDYKGMPGFVKLETKRKRNADVKALDFAQVGPIHPYCR